MKTKEQIKQEIAKLQQELDDYDTDLRPFIPSEGDTGYLVDTLGRIYKIVFSSSKHDAILIQNKPVFRTYAAAEHYGEVNRATLAVERKIAELNDGWWPDFGDSNEAKWVIGRDTFSSTFESYCYQRCHIHHPRRYLKSEQLAHQLIEEMPEELKLMILGE